MPRPTGSMPPVVSLAMDEQTPEPMSTCLASRLREQGQLAKPRVTSSGEQRSCRSASWRGGLVAGVTEYRKDRTWRSCDYRQSPSVLAGLNGCGGKGTNGLYRCGRASLPGQGSSYGQRGLVFDASGHRSAGDTRRPRLRWALVVGDGMLGR